MTVSLNKNAELVAECKAIQAEIDRLTLDLSARKAQLAASVKNATGKVVVGEHSFTVRENNRYDQSVMLDNLKPGQVRRCSVSKLDSAAVKRLYPEVYAMARVTNGVSVSIG